MAYLSYWKAGVGCGLAWAVVVTAHALQAATPVQRVPSTEAHKITSSVVGKVSARTPLTSVPPKTGNRFFAPKALSANASILASLKQQRQTVDIEFAQMKTARQTGSKNVPTNRAFPDTVLQKQGPPTVTGGNVEYGKNGSISVLPPSFDTTILSFSHDPSLRIFRGGGLTFTPIKEYNLYTIKGCSFGPSSPDNKIYIYGAGGFHQDFQIQFWSDNGVTVTMDPTLSGVLDRDNLSLVLHRADGKEIQVSGYKFFAARGDAAGKPVPLPRIARALVSTSYLTPVFESPVTDAAAPGTLALTERASTTPFPAGYDDYDFHQLAPGFDFETVELIYWYYVQDQCLALVPPPPNTNGKAELETQGSVDMSLSKDRLRVSYQVQTCYRVGISKGQAVNNTFSFSQYAPALWVMGPRCVDPWTGLADQACVKLVKQQLGGG